MTQTPTILAQASAPGHGPRAIIRAAGPRAFELLDLVCAAPTPRSRGAHAGVLKIRNVASEIPHLLPVIILIYRSPRTYTGEEAFELLLPSNPVLLDRVLQTLLNTPHAARLATPGEFTARAYLSGRLTLEQAEGIAATIAAENQAQFDAARRLMNGTQGAEYRDWADEILNLLALVEAGIDFTDQEDVVAIEPGELNRRIDVLERKIAATLAKIGGEASSSSHPQVVLVGPPSAGKSTLLNALLGIERAVTDAAPGTTRDVLRESLDLSREIPGAGTVWLVDLPGLDAHDQLVASARAAQAAARAAIQAADAVLYCDPSGRFAPGPEIPAGVPTIRVRTKADLPFEGAAESQGVAVCALDRWNLPVLRRAIADAAMSSARGHEMLLLPRHHRALAEASRLLGQCRELLQGDLREPSRARSLGDPTVIAELLRGAAEALGDITGRVAPDDVLGRIFATFCVGK
ncbi:MAG TPA: GTPase [Phycisphaerales bacterium]|nr:GTPase [Phycisphaerales bacterium]